jgi:hypothetical protein
MTRLHTYLNFAGNAEGVLNCRGRDHPRYKGESQLFSSR